MKASKLLLIILFSLIAFQVSSQSSFGIRCGYIKAWQNYGDVIIPDDAIIHVNRFQVSVLAYVDLNDHISIGIEPGFTQRGAACIPGSIFLSLPEIESKLLLNYAELPLMISDKLSIYKDKLEIFGKAGYGISRVQKAIRVDEFPGTGIPSERIKLPVSDPLVIRRLDNGWYAGAGISYNFGVNQLFLESNFYYGLRNVDPWFTSKNRSLHLGLGYRVRF